MKQKDHLDSDDFMQKMKRTVALREDCGIFFEQELPRPAGELFYAIEDQKLVRKDENRPADIFKSYQKRSLHSSTECWMKAGCCCIITRKTVLIISMYLKIM